MFADKFQPSTQADWVFPIKLITPTDYETMERFNPRPNELAKAHMMPKIGWAHMMTDSEQQMSDRERTNLGPLTNICKANIYEKNDTYSIQAGDMMYQNSQHWKISEKECNY